MSCSAQPLSNFQTRWFWDPTCPSLIKRGLEILQPLAGGILPTHPATPGGRRGAGCFALPVSGGWMISSFLIALYLFLSLTLTSLAYIPQRDFLVQVDLAKRTPLLQKFWPLWFGCFFFSFFVFVLFGACLLVLGFLVLFAGWGQCLFCCCCLFCFLVTLQGLFLYIPTFK